MVMIALIVLIAALALIAFGCWATARLDRKIEQDEMLKWLGR